MEKFKNKYRIPSARLATWDYSSPGFYFITLCTKTRLHFFGEIINNEMHLNETGKIAAEKWVEIPNHFQNTILGEFVVMPNHIHGIIIIEDSGFVETGQSDIVETGHALSLRQPNEQPKHFRFRNQGKKTISAMAGSFKSAVTKLAGPVNPGFGWQTRFHDHIIRSHEDYIRISNYILNNPANWLNDKFYK